MQAQLVSLSSENNTKVTDNNPLYLYTSYLTEMELKFTVISNFLY